MNTKPGSLTQSWIVYRKELMDWLRDRASIIGLLLQAIASPVVWAAILILANRTAQSELVLPVVGADHGAALVAWLNAQVDVEVVPAPPNPAEAVRKGMLDVVLLIQPEFADRTAEGLVASVELMIDGSAGASRRAAERVRGLIARYGAELGSLRLMARGIAPDIAAPVRLDTRDISPPDRRQGGLEGFVPALLLWMALVGGVAIAADSTLGERERASLEPLLLNPVSRTAVIAGKWLAAATLACAYLMAAGLATLVVLRSVPWHEYGFQLLSSDRDLLTATVLMAPLALFWSALVAFVSTISRSQQQAQTYMGLLFMTVVLTSIASIVFPLANVPWMAAVPVIGQLTLSVDLLGGGHPAAYRYIVTASATVLMALALVAAAAHILRRESIVFRS